MPTNTISGTVTSTVTLGGGVYVSPLTVTATGDVAPTAAGAAGIYVPAAYPGSITTNDGRVGGGNGGPTGGIGIDLLSAGTVTNDSTITGGAGGYYSNAAANGGTGIDLAAGGAATNSGLIAGGKAGGNYLANGAGGVGVATGASAYLSNGGMIVGGAAYSGYGTGGIGVDLAAGGTLVNTGTVQGGYGGAGTAALSSGLGSGVVFDSTGVLTNSGNIVGGSGIYTFGSLDTTSDGAGVVVKGAGTLTNTGTITGGANRTGAASGAAVDMLAGGTLTNSGSIIGATTGTLTGGARLDGGGGVYQVGGVLDNTGMIAAGASRYGLGGIGAYVNGGRLINAGTIIGGGTGANQKAVAFGSLGGTLVIEPGAVFDGGITATGQANTQVQLAGTTAATLTVNGSSFDDFRHFTLVTVEQGATWTLPGNGFGITTPFIDLGTLIVPGTVEIARLGHGTLLVGGAGKAYFGSIKMYGGTFANEANGAAVIGPTSTGGHLAETVINAGGTISGSGLITGNTVVDNGKIISALGLGTTLELSSAVTGAGVAQLNRDSTMRVDTSLSTKAVWFAGAVGNETLVIGNGASMTAPISGFGANDAIDVLGIQANGLTFLSGTLSLTENGTTVDQFAFKGTYTQENFRITPDTRGGTDIHYIATAPASSPDAASVPTSADLAGGAANADAWTGNSPAVPLYNGGEGGHAF